MGKALGKSLLCVLLLCSIFAHAQTNSGALPTGPLRDTSMNKSNTGKWREEDPNIIWEKLNSARIYYPDTAIHNFQRAPFTQPWYRDMGNLGSPAYNLLFTPDASVGPSLGYHVFDIYRYKPDSLNFYNTKRPYSNFGYQLGSKLEQTANLLHTQNIMPNWNFALEYRKTNAAGFYKTQRNNNDNTFLSTNYKSLDKHYQLFAGIIYNKEQHDENGGIRSDVILDSAIYSDRKTIPTTYSNGQYSITRSPVTNTLRDFTFVLQHAYMWGRTDTTYNTDSTQYSYKLTPRFSITHRLEGSTEKHTYKDLSPDSLRYTSLFQRHFTNGGTYVANGDSVFSQQKWFWVDNKFLLNGFIGKVGKQLSFSAGFGTRYDQFIEQPFRILIKDSLPKQYYRLGKDKSDMVNNYLAGEIKKEALQPGQWGYGANTRFFITGPQAGSFVLNAIISKQLKNDIGGFAAGFNQRLNSAPYSYEHYSNADTTITNSFNKESVTTIFATLESPKLRLSAGFRNYVVANFIYINEQEVPAQYSGTYSISQLWGRKVFRVGSFFLDNEIVFQQIPDNAPVNIPPIMGRHQLSYEKALFKRRLKLAAGIEARYNSAYNPAGYDALLNKFYYQTNKSVSNTPEMALFLNFRIKRFRAFIMGDNLQQLFARNAVLYTGTPIPNFDNTGSNYAPVYAAPDLLIRFGFNWMLVN